MRNILLLILILFSFSLSSQSLLELDKLRQQQLNNIIGGITGVEIFPQDNAAAISDDNSVGSWLQFGDGTTAVSVSTTAPYHGIRNMQVNVGTNGAQGLLQDITVESNRNYYVSIWAKRNSGSTNLEHAFLNWTGVSGFTPADITSDNWTEFNWSLVSTGSTLRVLAYATQGGPNAAHENEQVHLDKVSIIKDDEIYPYYNAASIYNEADATTGWSVETTGSVSSISSDVNHGVYAIDVTTTSGAGVSDTYADFTFPATIGTSYTVSWDMKRSSGVVAYGRAFDWSNVNTSPNITPTASWASYSYTVTATATGNITCKFYSSASGVESLVGDKLLVDKISVIEN